MQPDVKVRHRDQRHAWRGIATGRHRNRKVKTTYGRKSQERDRLARWHALREEYAVNYYGE